MQLRPPTPARPPAPRLLNPLFDLCTVAPAGPGSGGGGGSGGACGRSVRRRRGRRRGCGGGGGRGWGEGEPGGCQRWQQGQIIDFSARSERGAELNCSRATLVQALPTCAHLLTACLLAAGGGSPGLAGLAATLPAPPPLLHAQGAERPAGDAARPQRLACTLLPAARLASGAPLPRLLCGAPGICQQWGALRGMQQLSWLAGWLACRLSSFQQATNVSTSAHSMTRSQHANRCRVRRRRQRARSAGRSRWRTHRRLDRRLSCIMSCMKRWVGGRM